MKTEAEQLEALTEIRKMMKESSRFVSLSGLSGILAGCYALAGAAAAHFIIERSNQGITPESYTTLTFKLILLALLVLSVSLLTAFFLSGRKAKRTGHKLFDHASKKLMWSMAVPLIAGGLICISLILRGGALVHLVCPIMLVFYGLALFASSRLTLDDIKYLGYLEITLGIVSCFFNGYALLFWATGFGLLHIIYGTIMWYRHDRNL